MLEQLIAGIALALILIGPAVAGPLEDGYVAYSRGDYAEAVRLIRPLAEQGDIDAVIALAHMMAGEEMLETPTPHIHVAITLTGVQHWSGLDSSAGD